MLLKKEAFVHTYRKEMALFNLNLSDPGAKDSKGTRMSNSGSQDPFEDAWIKSSILQEDDLLMTTQLPNAITGLLVEIND